MATDFLQGLILVPLTVIVAWLCLNEMGGISNLFQQIEAQGLAKDYQMVNSAMLFGGAYTWGWASAMATKQFIVFNSMNAAPRYFSVKDGNEARKAALLGSVLMILGSIVWLLPPITSRLLYPEMVLAFDISKPAEASYAVASMSLLPVGLVGLIVVAILAATMSSMDTGLNTNVAILIKDVYPKLARKLKWEPKAEKQLLGYGRLLTWFMGFLIVLLALYFAQRKGVGIFDLMIEVGTLLSMPITIPLLWGMFIRKTPWWAALFSIGCALCVSCLAFFEIPVIEGLEWNFQQQFFSVLAAGTFGFLFSMLFAPATDSEHRKLVNKFFKTMKTPIDFATEIGEGNDLKQLDLIGRFGIAVTVFIALLLFIPNPMEGRIAILVLAMVIGIVSVLMIKAGKKSNKFIDS